MKLWDYGTRFTLNCLKEKGMYLKVLASFPAQYVEAETEKTLVKKQTVDGIGTVECLGGTMQSEQRLRDQRVSRPYILAGSIELLMASTRKGDKENSQDVEEMGCAAWSREILLIFCDLCIELIDKSTRKITSQRLCWTECKSFKRKLDELKHKYDGMRTRWSLWKKLKRKETSLGWDYEKGTITASDKWWMKKIDEDIKFKQFRNKGIEPELQSKMHQLFGAHVAMGDDITSPNMDPLPTPMEEDQLRAYIPSQPNSDGFQNQPFTLRILALGLVHGKSYGVIACPRPLLLLFLRGHKMKEAEMVKKKRSAAMMYEKLESMMEAIISEKKERDVEREARRIERKERRSKKSVSVKDGTTGVPNALAKICALPHFDPLHPIFIFACGLMEDPQKRMILLGLPNDESRFRWLIYL
ncbi:hypothetical protein Cgig2_008538 [Carnegiea gigantea]|uniref:Myb/SANT-like domain-containing protein n=1 Tax=Carnegiea gigantea TaxID=171969 RepID=A0A9Q1Q8Y4_9CARY|nr:hypothetical protein Cgig2_008538 [Carnegiea gigantea]